jgi:hypothetical protein
MERPTSNKGYSSFIMIWFCHSVRPASLRNITGTLCIWAYFMEYYILRNIEVTQLRAAAFILYNARRRDSRAKSRVSLEQCRAFDSICNFYLELRVVILCTIYIRCVHYGVAGFKQARAPRPAPRAPRPGLPSWAL